MTTGRAFAKMSGSGNDFVFSDGRANPLAFWTPERIREVCARQTGVGGDGLWRGRGARRALGKPLSGSLRRSLRAGFGYRDDRRGGTTGNTPAARAPFQFS